MTQGGGTLSDAELVPRVLAGDREAFAQVYDRYADRLYDFACGTLRNREEAADAVADCFVTVAEKLHQLRDADRLRPWLYSVTRRHCLARIKQRSRQASDAEERLSGMAENAEGPAERAQQDELRRLVWDAAAGLAERDRSLLDLHLRHGLEGAELGEAMGVSANNAYVMLSRLRKQVERSLGALLVARAGRKDCDELRALLVDWDGRFSPLIRKRVARHVDQCDLCGRQRAAMVSPTALLSGVPLLAAPAALRTRVLDDVELVAHTGLATDDSVRRPSAPVGLTVAAAVALLVVVAALLLPDNRPIALSDPLDDSVTAPHDPVPGRTLAPVDDAPSPGATVPGSPPARTEPTSTPTAAAPSPPPPATPPTFGGVTTRAGGCGPDRSVHVSTSITAAVPVRSANISWSGAGASGSSRLTAAGDRWAATVGPFPESGQVTLRLTATDESGRTGDTSHAFTLPPCPA